MAELKHVYHRELDPEDPQRQDSLAKIARLIAPKSRVLDVGCGPGALGEYLTRERGCIVDGVELNAEAARMAARSYRKVAVADLETFAFDSLGEAAYDYIVCADVLEHLKDPTVIATRLIRLLAKSGRLLISIPNVGYAGLIAGLINGDFQYRAEGLLDATHLRFFTRRSLLDWLGEVGLHALSVDTVRIELSDSEFTWEGLEGFAPALREQLLSTEDALTYQFIVQAVPVDAERRPTQAEKQLPAAVTYLCKLYWCEQEQGFDEARSAFHRAKLGVDPQRIRFPLPPLTSSELTLRLDIADRPGYMRLYDVAVYDADGLCLWKWDLRRDPIAGLRTHELMFVDDEQRGQLMVSSGIDPWMVLPFTPPGPQALARGGYVEVDLTWPMSNDSLAVATQLSREGVRASLEKLDAQKNRLLEELEVSRREQRRLFVERARFAEERAILERARVQLEATAKATAAELAGARKEIEDLRGMIEQINQSITFRAARPVFAVVNRLRGLGKDKK